MGENLKGGRGLGSGAMGIKYVLLVNKQGHTRLSQYYVYHPIDERVAMEGEIIRKCLGRSERQCSFIKYQDYKIIYRRYASLFFIVATDPEANELAILEFIHLLVETLDKFFRNVCELDIMFNLDRAHMLLEEMVMNGRIVESSHKAILEPVELD